MRALEHSTVIWKKKNWGIMIINPNFPINSLVQYLNLFFIFLSYETRIYISPFSVGLYEI